jgi:hypothetical protein
MSVGVEVGEYFECPRFIIEVAPISWSWSCCTILGDVTQGNALEVLRQV